jgi:hypothetical protein
MIDRCKRVGYKLARIDFGKFSRRVSIVCEIFDKSVLLNLDNQDFRGEINDVVITRFELKLAA